MTMSELILHIICKKAWGKSRTAEEFGVSRVTLFNRLRRLGGKTGFEMSVLSVACRNGFVEEAISVLFAGPPGRASPVLQAAALFPDLSSRELEKLREVETTMGGNPLSVEMVRSIIEELRRPPWAPQKNTAPVEEGADSHDEMTRGPGE